jgi:hypothetical protein
MTRGLEESGLTLAIGDGLHVLSNDHIAISSHYRFLSGSDPLELSQLHRVELDKSQPLYSSYGPDCSTSLYNSKGHLLPRLDKVRKASGKKHKFPSSLHGSPSQHRTMSWLKIGRPSAASRRRT